MIKLPDLEAWAVFAKVAETGSFARAAEALGLSKPTVSKAITRLEGRLRTSLIHRSSRRLSLTEIGRASLELAARILHDGETVEAEVMSQSTAPKGLVRMAAPLSFGAAHLGPALPEFLERYPEVSIDFRLSDHQVNVIADGFDLALRIAAMPDSSLLSRRLCTVRILLVGSPGYFAKHGRPTHPKQLADHVGMCFTGGAARESLGAAWRFHHKTKGDCSVQVPFQIFSDNADLLTPALLTGRGLALQPEFLVWRELRQGLLESPMPDWSAGELTVHLIMSPSPLRPARVQVLIDYLAQRFVHPPWNGTA
jgi:DNA-binding transcriptional LysR family regulator